MKNRINWSICLGAVISLFALVVAINVFAVGEADFIAGDVNGDGVVNSKDVTHFARYLAGWTGIELVR